MNTEERASVETEERNEQPDQPQTVPTTWVPAVGPEPKRAEPAQSAAESPVDIAPAASAAAYSPGLSFACVLIPRFSDHYLVGDIVDSLTVWMKQACISYGWRLDALSIRPGYMQWVMQVPLNANPARFMRLLRQYTSEKTFEDFPRFRQRNISGEFWAPGNFVVPGDQLQSPEQVNAFMLQTRRMQGIA